MSAPGAQSTSGVVWADQQFELLPDKAMHWPSASTLIVADVHMGKADHFQQAGVPVPDGVTAADLRRLTALLRATRAARLLILGDLFHARTGMSPAMLDQLGDWRQQHHALSITLVRGNHDRSAGDPPASLNITCTDALTEQGIAFRHEPADDAAQLPHSLPSIAGHVHPAVRLHARGQVGMRLPCFWFGTRAALLPAFGSFTGMHVLRPKRGDRVFAVGPGEVIDVSAAICTRC